MMCETPRQWQCHLEASYNVYNEMVFAYSFLPLSPLPNTTFFKNHLCLLRVCNLVLLLSCSMAGHDGCSIHIQRELLADNGKHRHDERVKH